MTDSPLYGEGSAGLGTFVAIRGPTRESRLALERAGPGAATPVPIPHNLG